MDNINMMIEKIKDYCRNIKKCDCNTCPLKDKIYCWGSDNEEIIKENYKLIFFTDTKTNKHLKGYIYDSLAYRYQLARERQLIYEIHVEGIDLQRARKNFKRDILRFYEILDEAIGEHENSN